MSRAYLCFCARLPETRKQKAVLAMKNKKKYRNTRMLSLSSRIAYGTDETTWEQSTEQCIQERATKYTTGVVEEGGEKRGGEERRGKGRRGRGKQRGGEQRGGEEGGEVKNVSAILTRAATTVKGKGKTEGATIRVLTVHTILAQYVMMKEGRKERRREKGATVPNKLVDRRGKPHTTDQ